MEHGKAVEKRLTKGANKGYPWMIVLDADGKELANGDAPSGNIGCPVTAEEASWFFEMLTKSSQRLTEEDMNVLRSEHAAFAKPILERSAR